jgi:peptidoglycan/xylan/chitin deacetylase (PgdA/CDA1 family)
VALGAITRFQVNDPKSMVWLYACHHTTLNGEPVTSTSTRRVPILMYHEIGDPSETNSRLAVSPAAFAEQLAYLHNEGFATITAGALSAILTDGTAEIPDRTVVITFDDGYEDFYSKAMPLLEQYGFTATVFVTTGWVQDAETRPARNAPGRMLSWSQLTEVAGAGIEIGAHTRQHPQLDQLPAKLLREELCTSKDRLEDKLGLPVPGLAYPFGYSNAMVRQVARDVGYGYGHAVRNMTASPTSDLFEIPRLTVRRATTMSAFQQLVYGGLPMTILQDRALTKGYAVVRRARATLNMNR